MEDRLKARALNRLLNVGCVEVEAREVRADAENLIAEAVTAPRRSIVWSFSSSVPM